VKASPLARKVAAEYGIELAQVHGTGPGGRVVEADVEEFRQRGAPAAPKMPSAAPGGAAAASERPLSPIRKTIARRLTESKQTIPHFYLTTDVDAAPMVALRARYNAARAEELKVTFNDLVVKASALAIARFPAVNSQLHGDTQRTLAGIHVGVAVSLPEGLIVPVVRDCEQKSLGRIAAEIRDLAARARAGRLQPAEYSGGSFTVSNLGMYDVEEFAAVINPPEAAILAVGAIRDTPVIENSAVVPGKRMRLTISVDHRIVDGATAAQFLAEIKRLLQEPMSLVE
jgi:pyruvate dehydrogenase E2 component (dihydrolipoamide acetyltransferase)